MDYETFKNWLAEKENKQKILLGVCFLLVFIIGFGTGRLGSQLQKSSSSKPSNYTTKPVQTPSPAVKGAATVNTATTSPADCLIKGNINTKGYKIYHVPGGMYYKIVKPEQCFATEKDALAAGFVKSSR
jgi:hypothetical protein